MAAYNTPFRNLCSTLERTITKPPSTLQKALYPLAYKKLIRNPCILSLKNLLRNPHPRLIPKSPFSPALAARRPEDGSEEEEAKDTARAGLRQRVFLDVWGLGW